jgi:hypothetical protein
MKSGPVPLFLWPDREEQAIKRLLEICYFGFLGIEWKRHFPSHKNPIFHLFLFVLIAMDFRIHTQGAKISCLYF